MYVHGTLYTVFAILGEIPQRARKERDQSCNPIGQRKIKNSAMFLLLVSGNSLNFNLSIGGVIKNNLTFLLSVASDGPSFGQMRFNPTEPRGPLQ